MNNFKKTEANIGLRHNNEKFATAYSRLYTFYCFYDELHKSNHCTILNLVYRLPKRKFSYKKIAYLSNVSDSTLLRYRKKYADHFDYFLSVSNVDWLEIALARLK